MRRILALVLSVALLTLSFPAGLQAAAPQQTGGVNGVAHDASQKPLPKYTIQLRNAQGQLVGSTTSDLAGGFSFAGLQPGAYTIEIVDAAGNILGTATVTVTAGAVATVSVTATALGLAAAAAGEAGGLAGLFTGTSLLVVTAATIAGVTGLYFAFREEASPSR